MRQDTKKGAATFKLRALTSEIGGDMQHAEAFQKSIQSHNKVRSRTPWLARAIGVTRARSEDDYFFVVLPYGCMRQLWLPAHIKGSVLVRLAFSSAGKYC